MNAGNERLSELLNRPLEQRIREYKYRFGQSVVFGIPVVALHLWGRALGPADYQRWGSLLAALLCGWVVYVNVGMLVEGILTRRVSGDVLVGAVALALYLCSLVSATHGIVTAHLLYPLMFHWCVIILAAWSLWRWIRLRSAT